MSERPNMLGYIRSMPNTSVHFPESLLASLNRIAAERGISRNRVIVESCRRTAEERAHWPEGLFLNDHLSDSEVKLLRRGERDFQQALESARRSRSHPPL